MQSGVCIVAARVTLALSYLPFTTFRAQWQFLAHMCYFYQVCRTALSRAVTSVNCQMCSLPEPLRRIWQIRQTTQTRQNRPSAEAAHWDLSLQANVWTDLNSLNFHTEHEGFFLCDEVLLFSGNWKAAIKTSSWKIKGCGWRWEELWIVKT